MNILTMDDVGWFNNMLRPLFGAIDQLIYSLLGFIVNGIFALSSLMASPNLTQLIYRRIYVILGIFMVFKLSFSFLQYLVSPDKMVDKEQGAGKVIARTVTMLAILILLPIIFFESVVPNHNEPLLTVLQNGVIRTIPKIVLGIPDDGSSVSSTAKSNGEFMAVMMLRSFYYPSECNPDSSNYDSTANCDVVSGNNITNLRDFRNTLNSHSGGIEYDYQYMWPLTTVAGILLVVIMVGMAIDIAIRTFKLLILQMMAPVPVMTYIDPKSSKDGAFNSWLKTFITTYIDIFVKLATIYLLLLLVSKMFDNSSTSLFGTQIADIDGFMTRNLVRVALIWGLFKFAKDAPKFIKDAMGIKDSGGGSGFMGKAMAGLAGAATGFAAGGVAGAVSGFSAGAANAGSGKPANVYGQVRDERAKALGRTPGGLKGKLNQASLQRKVNRSTGLNKQTLAAAKADAEEKQAEFDKMKIENENTPGTHDADKLMKAQAKAASASSKYEKASKLADNVGLKKGFMDDPKNKSRSSVYRAFKNLQYTTKDAAGTKTRHWDDIKDDHGKVEDQMGKLGVDVASRRGGFAEDIRGSSASRKDVKAAAESVWDAERKLNQDRIGYSKFGRKKK